MTDDGSKHVRKVSDSLSPCLVLHPMQYHVFVVDGSPHVDKNNNVPVSVTGYCEPPKN